MQRALILSWITITSVLMSCGGGTSMPVAADGGSSGAGGTSGSQVPDCLRAVFAACPTTGTCTGPSTLASSSQSCYANGVRVDAVRVDSCAGDGHATLGIRKSDGSLCYTVELYEDQLCEGEAFAWTDAGGNLLATGSWGGLIPLGSMLVQCTAGAKAPCTDGQCTLGSHWVTNTCTAGPCP